MKSIHFVCRGNVYRSRLAEAYAKSILEDKVSARISSSGIEAEKALNGEVDSETVRLLKKESIENYLTPSWHQTTQEDINDNDRIIFMSQTLYSQAKKSFDLPQDKIETWDIPDVDGIYPKIKEKVDELIKAEFDLH